jgi:hypothetical protein
MTTQLVTGFAYTNQSTVPLSTTITDGSDSQEIKTNSTYTVTSQSLGTFAEGQTLQAMFLQAATGICWGIVLRNGQAIGICQSLGSLALGGGMKAMPIMPGPITLVAGDQILCRSEA